MTHWRDRQLHQLNSEWVKSKSVIKTRPSMNLWNIYQILYALMPPEDRTSNFFLKCFIHSLLTLPCEPSTSLRTMTNNYTWFSCCLYIYWGLDCNRANTTLASSFFCYGLSCSNCEKESFHIKKSSTTKTHEINI